MTAQHCGSVARVRAQPCPGSVHPLLQLYSLQVDYEDAFRVAVPPGTTLGQALAEVCRTPWWMNAAMWLRDQLLARPLGLARRNAELRARQARGELFTVVAEHARARLMRESDSHLEFQLLVELVADGPTEWLVMTTRVRFKNRAGRLYFLPVGPVHRRIVPGLMTRAGRRLWARAG